MLKDEILKILTNSDKHLSIEEIKSKIFSQVRGHLVPTNDEIGIALEGLIRSGKVKINRINHDLFYV